MKTAIRKIIETKANYSTLPIRLGLGVTMAAHGSQKLFGVLGGYGLEGTGQFFESIGISPGYMMAGLAGGTELIGGLVVFIGLLTRPAALALAGTMIVAIVTVHPDAFFLPTGMEYALALLLMSLTLVLSGGGSLSTDSVITK